MSLPVDPAVFTEDDIGEKVTTLEMDHEAAIEEVRTVCEEVGFGIPVEFSPAELLNEKVDADREPLYVLGACNPHLADRALDQTPGIAALFPCNMIVREIEPGVQAIHHVSIMRIARLLGMAPDNDEWGDIIDEAGDLADAAFDALADR